MVTNSYGTQFICCRVPSRFTNASPRIDLLEYKMPFTNWKENEIVGNKQLAEMESGTYIEGARGLPSMS